MARKVFISILGTSPYLETKYYFGNKPIGDEKPLRFVQEATINHLCKDWTRQDRVRMFLTKDAEKTNWVDNGNKEPYDGLQSRLNNLNLKFDLKAITIKEGFSENEIWSIFETVFNEIEENSEIYFDITHAFRSLPMLVMVLINYSKFLKNVKVRGIYYGVFEKLGPAYKVKKIDVEKRYAPIIDLIAFSDLQDWTNATNDFVSFGNTNKLLDITSKEIKPLAREFKGSNETINSLNNLINKLPTFISNITTCRGKNIFENREGYIINENLKHISDNFISPLKPILYKIEEKLYPFGKKDNIINGFNAVKWCIDNNLIQQGFTILQENMISLVLDELKMDKGELINRNIASSCFKIKMDNISQQKWMGDAMEYPDKTNRILNNSTLISLFIKDFVSISQLRNDINHAGYRENPVSSKKLKGYLEKTYSIVISKIKLSC